MKASRKTVHGKVLICFGKNTVFFSLKKKVMVLNMYFGINVLVYIRWVVVKVRHTVVRLNAFAIP